MVLGDVGFSDERGTRKKEEEKVDWVVCDAGTGAWPGGAWIERAELWSGSSDARNCASNFAFAN